MELTVLWFIHLPGEPRARSFAIETHSKGVVKTGPGNLGGETGPASRADRTAAAQCCFLTENSRSLLNKMMRPFLQKWYRGISTMHLTLCAAITYIPKIIEEIPFNF
jgi:hypothetical protein